MGRICGSPPALAHLHGHRPRVRIADLERLGLTARLDDLVSGWENRDAWPTVDRCAFATDHRQQRDFSKSQPTARGENDAALLGFDPLRVEILAGFERPGYLDAIAGALGMLHHHHRIGAFGQRRARHYFNRPSGAYGAAENLSRAHFADHAQVRREHPRRERQTRREPSVGREDNRDRR